VAAVKQAEQVVQLQLLQRGRHKVNSSHLYHNSHTSTSSSSSDLSHPIKPRRPSILACNICNPKHLPLLSIICQLLVLLLQQLLGRRSHRVDVDSPTEAVVVGVAAEVAAELKAYCLVEHDFK
jgi:hypothetical protein